jgi:hypothetical protein
MYEGELVEAMRYPLNVTSPNGAPPQAAVVAEESLSIGGVDIPAPLVVDTGNSRPGG